jgi:F-type H+-transporting ATPase subunit b
MLDIDWTLPVALVSVIVFLFLMNKVLFKPLVQLMEARDKRIQDDLEQAARLRQQAEGAMTTYETALAAARRDMGEQAAAVQRAMESKQREQIDAARRQAHTMVTGAEATVEQETQEARLRLADQARELARLVVAKFISREVGR